jgi:hypothetical protein
LRHFSFKSEKKIGKRMNKVPPMTDQRKQLEHLQR